MEAKQIEARIGDWLRVVNSVATKGDFRRFYPKIFPNHFSKAVFTLILNGTWIFDNLRISVKNVFSSLCVNKKTMRKTISVFDVCFFCSFLSKIPSLISQETSHPFHAHLRRIFSHSMCRDLEKI